ncbi:MAG: RNA polymerase sporulation sigma factor SigK [Defluviitaleaceae bacterium]|nr:RNA polymerase sporulation sigma factor SigK [Defluviitaleaceae bacterium]
MFFGLILEGFFLLGHLAGGNSFPKPLSADEEKIYLEKYSDGDKDAGNILIEHNLRLVAYVAKKYNNHAKDAEDLISVGTIGLIKGVASYKPDKGTRLATYAIRCIENEILMFIRAGRKSAGDIYLQDIVGVDREGNEVRVEDKIADDKDAIDEQVNLKMQTKRLREVVCKVLYGREKAVITKRYGLGAGGEEKTQREIAGELSISRSYVSRIEKKALAKLRKEMYEM